MSGLRLHREDSPRCADGDRFAMKNTKMKNQRARTRKAFTMIELLVVIAIIAILAAILFPVFATVREQARQSSTMSNMQAVYVGAKLYNEDEGHYPSVLFGYAEVYDKGLTPPYRPVTTMDDKKTITAMNSIAGTFRTSNKTIVPGYLYHEQIKDYVTFLAGDDAVTDKSATTVAYYPPYSPSGLGGTQSIGSKVNVSNLTMATWNSTQTAAGAGCSVYGDSDVPAKDNMKPPTPYADGTPKVFYKMDAMDIGPMLNSDGTVVRDPNNNNSIVYELHYSPDWTHELWKDKTCDVDNTADKNPLSNQLKYKNPPTDRTVLTYVTSHVGFGNSQKVLVLLLSGTVRKMEAKDAVKQLPLNY